MKNSSIYKTVGLVTFMILFLSCSAEDGEDGAIGPQGPQGEQGISGTNGTDGIDGADGNANVIASEWLYVTFSPIVGNTFSTTLTDDRITTEVMENSVFLLYARNSTTDPQSLITIPFTEPTLGVSFYYVLDASLNQIEVLGVFFSGATPFPDLIDQIRFVIIPPSLDSSSLANLTYDEVVDRFGLN